MGNEEQSLHPATDMSKRILITGASRGIGRAIAAKTGFANWSAYCMSKFALEGFSQSVRDELREHRIRMINIYPAATNTEIWDDVTGDWPREKMIAAEEVASAVAYGLSRPENVAVENVTLSNDAGNL